MNSNLYHPVTIGNLQLPGNLFLAPVAGYSDCAFRSLCREGGADFTYTEMVSSEALVRSSGNTEQLMHRAPGETQYAVQLFGGDSRTMGKAVDIVMQTVSPEAIDINAGCPVPKIIKSGAGSALTRDPERLYDVTKAAVESSGGIIPITVKIRSGWDADHLSWKEAAAASLEADCSAITLHARTRAQGYEGKADWNLLAELVSFVQGKVPVFASGDIFTPQDVQTVLCDTQCDGVMFARGAMGNPFIFRETKLFLQTGELVTTSSAERVCAGMRELDILIAEKGELSACREMRKRFCSYSKGLSGGARLRESIVTASSKDEYLLIFQEFLSC